jgi:hypothetical protein
MNQATHAWVALRAIKLLEEEGEAGKLVGLLKPHAREAAIGAWIPDKTDAKRGGAKTENHILKMKPFNEDKGNWFVVDKKTLLSRLGANRQMVKYIKNDSSLDAAWWGTSYKAEPKPGQHLANRAMALATTIVDLLILGDEDIDSRIPGTISFVSDLPAEARTSESQAALHFFMLSHFVADACMPCHCDKRDLSDYSNGLHDKLEHHWGDIVGPEFDEQALLGGTKESVELLRNAKDIDNKLEITFPDTVPKLKASDVWLETINVCRASFALVSIIAPPKDYPYDVKNKKAPLETLFPNPDSNDELAEFSQMVLHDAVLNTAIVWKHAWEKAQPKSK